MPTPKRVFISFAIEDRSSYVLLAGQAKNDRTPFEMVDMGVKQPWDEKWKTNCRSRIKGCDGMIALVSKNTSKAAGALWEVQCAKEEKVRVLGLYCTTDNRPLSLPAEFNSVRVADWTWENLTFFIASL